MNDTSRADERYEGSDVSGRFVFRFAVAFVVVAAGLTVLALVLSRALWPQPPSMAPMQETAPVPGPQLQREPAADMAAMRAETRRRLNGFGWVDRDQGIGHIPIERAMELLVEREQRGGER